MAYNSSPPLSARCYIHYRHAKSGSPDSTCKAQCTTENNIYTLLFKTRNQYTVPMRCEQHINRGASSDTCWLNRECWWGLGGLGSPMRQMKDDKVKYSSTNKAPSKVMKIRPLLINITINHDEWFVVITTNTKKITILQCAYTYISFRIDPIRASVPSLNYNRFWTKKGVLFTPAGNCFIKVHFDLTGNSIYYTTLIG